MVPVLSNCSFCAPITKFESWMKPIWVSIWINETNTCVNMEVDLSPIWFIVQYDCLFGYSFGYVWCGPIQCGLQFGTPFWLCIWFFLQYGLQYVLILGAPFMVMIIWSSIYLQFGFCPKTKLYNPDHGLDIILGPFMCIWSPYGFNLDSKYFHRLVTIW